MTCVKEQEAAQCGKDRCFIFPERLTAGLLSSDELAGAAGRPGDAGRCTRASACVCARDTEHFISSCLHPPQAAASPPPLPLWKSALTGYIFMSINSKEAEPADAQKDDCTPTVFHHHGNGVQQASPRSRNPFNPATSSRSFGCESIQELREREREKKKIRDRKSVV